jgi:predicted transcriptional regulator
MHPDRRALLISLRPRFAELLLQGTKTVELRRVQPAVSRGTLVLLYASSPTRALVGTGVVADVQAADHEDIWRRHGMQTGISRDEYDEYFAGAAAAVAITLHDVQRLSNPLPLSQLRKGRGWFRPPQSFRYLDAQQTASFGLSVPAPAAPPLDPWTTLTEV